MNYIFFIVILRWWTSCEQCCSMNCRKKPAAAQITLLFLIFQVSVSQTVCCGHWGSKRRSQKSLQLSLISTVVWLMSCQQLKVALILACVNCKRRCICKRFKEYCFRKWQFPENRWSVHSLNLKSQIGFMEMKTLILIVNLLKENKK